MGGGDVKGMDFESGVGSGEMKSGVVVGGVEVEGRRRVREGDK